MRRSLGFLIVVGLAQACSTQDHSPTPAAPVSVAAPVKESALSTVTLSEEATRRLAIQTATVVTKNVPRTRSYPARIEAVPGSWASIAAPVAGQLLETPTPPVPGMRVARGQVLMRIRPLVTADADLIARAQRDIAVAKARVEATKQRSNRLAELARTGAASQRASDDAVAELAIAEADLAEATTRSGRLRENPFVADAALPLRAPDAGTVLRLVVAPGQIVTAGAPLIEIARVERAWVRVAVYAGDVAQVARAAPGAVLQLGGRDARAIAPVDAPALADPTSAVVELVYSVDNPDAAFLPGQRVLAMLPLAGETSGAVVPLASVIYDVHGGAWLYTVDKPHSFTRRRIEIRDIIGQDAVLARGPAPGTTVVTAGASELYGSEFGSK